MIDLKGLETLTSVSIDTTAGTITYIDEDLVPTVLNVRNLVKVHETVTAINVAGQTFTYTDEDGGTVTVDIRNLETTTTMTGVQGTGKIIGTYRNEDLVDVNIRETVTTLTDNANGTYTYNSENATTTTIDLYSSNRIAEIYDIAGTQTLSTAYANVNFATSGIVDPGFTATTNSITVTTPGRYRITYRVTTSVTDNTRTGAEFELTRNGVTQPGSYASTYQRNNDVDRNTIAVTKVVDLVANDVIRVRGRRYSSFGSIQMVANGSSLLIERLK